MVPRLGRRKPAGSATGPLRAARSSGTQQVAEDATDVASSMADRRVKYRARDGMKHYTVGRIFWFRWKKFVGSILFFSATSRSWFGP